jgi:hypothetical protein
MLALLYLGRTALSALLHHREQEVRSLPVLVQLPHFTNEDTNTSSLDMLLPDWLHGSWGMAAYVLCSPARVLASKASPAKVGVSRSQGRQAG